MMLENTLIFSLVFASIGYCAALLIKKRDGFFRSDDLFLGSLLGSVFFLSVFGVHTLYISNVGWALEGDATAHVVGLHFFRSEPWGFPIGAIRNYGYPYGTGLLGIEGYPFLLLVKLFNPWFPQEPLQFHGIWMLICYMLQGTAGMLLMRRISSHVLIKALGTILFIMSPIILLRAGAHTALMSHFLILFAIDLLFIEIITRRTIVAWAVVFFFGLWIHVYLLVMCCILMLAFFYKQVVISRFCTVFRAFRLWILSLVPCIILFFILHPITPSVSLHKGFGYHSMNLNSPINPLEGEWSKVFIPHFWGSGQFEGYNYLGAGIIFLICALVLHAKKIIMSKEWLQDNYWFFLLCFALTFYAVSNVVTLGNLTLVHYPNIYGSLAETFRASGRFFWPVWYLLLFGALKLLAQKESRRTILTLLACATIIQGYDLSGMFQGFHNKFHADKKWETPLKSTNWDILIKNYARVFISPPGLNEENFQRYIIPFGLMAATYKKQINVGFFSRFPSEMLTAAQHEHNGLKLGQYKNDTLYILSGEDIEPLIYIKKETDLLARIDSYIVFAPNFPANTLALESFSIVNERYSEIPPDKKIEIDFSSGFSRLYLTSGWSDTEEWGTWSESDEALVTLYYQGKPQNDILLRTVFRVFLADVLGGRHISVYANNHSVAEWNFSGNEDQTPVIREMTIPSSVFDSTQLQLKFHIEKAISPSQLGLGKDKRRLGIGLMEMRILPVVNSEN